MGDLVGGAGALMEARFAALLKPPQPLADGIAAAVEQPGGGADAQLAGAQDQAVAQGEVWIVGPDRFIIGRAQGSPPVDWGFGMTPSIGNILVPFCLSV